MKGIIHSIIRLVDCCRASAVGMTDIFCIAHMEAPTSTAIKGVGSGMARSSHRKPLSNGTTWCTRDSHEYKWLERLARDSGLVGRT